MSIFSVKFKVKNSTFICMNAIEFYSCRIRKKYSNSEVRPHYIMFNMKETMDQAVKSPHQPPPLPLNSHTKYSSTAVLI